MGKIDIIVNNAGYTLDAPIHKMSDDWFQRMLDIHLVVPFRVIRAAAPHLREPAKQEREEGREVFRKIVNVSSTSGTFGNAGQANYAAGKAGVVGLTKTLAKEWGQFKINVNAVAFGFVDTRLTQSKVDENTMEIDGEKVQLGIPEQMRSMALDADPARPRRRTPQEAAGGVFFLCSPWSNYVHGQTLHITGGMFGGDDAADRHEPGDSHARHASRQARRERELPRGVVGGAEISQATDRRPQHLHGPLPRARRARGRGRTTTRTARARCYMLRGAIEIRWGDQLEQSVGSSAGDMLYVPPRETHIVATCPTTEPAEYVVARDSPTEDSVEVPWAG